MADFNFQQLDDPINKPKAKPIPPAKYKSVSSKQPVNVSKLLDVFLNNTTPAQRDNTSVTPTPVKPINNQESAKDAYYNPKLKTNVSSGDKRLDFLYNHQWLMNTPIIGQKIKDAAYDVAKRSKGTGNVENVDEVRKQPENYKGNALFSEDGDPKVDLLDQYFGKVSLPASKYKPNSDYLNFLPSVSVKGQFDKVHKGDYDMTDVIKSVSGHSKLTDFSKPIYKNEAQDSKMAEVLGVDLGGHKTGIAFDKERNLPYVSISDAWDFEPNSYNGGKSDQDGGKEYVQAALMHKAGTPFKVYDRLYFDPNTNKYIPDEKLPQVKLPTKPIFTY